MPNPITVTRFAPSPNGPLHLGHAYSAIVAHDLARVANGRFLLRIEDIDGTRSRSDLANAFREDLEWLGLEWEEVAAQSRRLPSYETAARTLKARGLLYPCCCTRAEITATATVTGPEGPVYPGTCKHRNIPEGEPVQWRIDMERALAETGPLEWTDALAGVQQCEAMAAGDIVLVRKEAPASYHLAATLDDAADSVNLVTRGADLFAASHIHRVLQELLGLPVPVWHHHDLLLDASGQKLAKRKNSPSLGDRRIGGQDGRELAEQLRAENFPAGISLGCP